MKKLILGILAKSKIQQFGCGKTLFLTYKVIEYMNKYKDKKVFANYTIKNDNVNYFDFLDFIENSEDYKNSIIAIDEISQYIDSRVSNSKTNRFFTKIINQSRKYNSIILYTAQHEMEYDKRLREKTNYYSLIEKIWEESEFSTNKLFVVDLAIYLNQQFHALNSFYFRPKDQLYQMYNTYELVNINKNKGLGKWIN